jgi:cell division inhibitor SulA/protein ImuA
MPFEDLIADPRIWRGRGQGRAAIDALPTGFDALDRYLPGGGWPRRALTEILLDRYGIGELSIFMPALAQLSELAALDARWIVWIAPPYVPYAPALRVSGIDLSRVLLVQPTCEKKDVLWAIEQALRSGSSIAVLAWLERASSIALRRLQLAAEEHNCWTLLFRSRRVRSDSSPAALRVCLSSGSDHARLEIVKCRGKRPYNVALKLAVPNHMRVLPN